MGDRRGGARVGLRPPPSSKKKEVFGYIGGVLLRFSHFWGPFHHMGAFLLHGGGGGGGGGGLFFGLPLPLRKFLLAPMIARRVGEHAPRNFLCDRNLVSSGHVLLRFCLKNDKNNDKL